MSAPIITDTVTDTAGNTDTDTDTGTGRRALVGSIIHSVALGELQIFKHGAIVYSPSGIIEHVFDLEDSTSKAAFESMCVETVTSVEGKLIMPGFVDCHCHAPQYEFTGTGIDVPLLEWLKKYTFPCESKFADVNHAQKVYSKTVLRHMKCGTTFASYFATIHKDATFVLADVIEELGQRAFVGKVSMDRYSI
jgi:guanine deaminase